MDWKVPLADLDYSEAEENAVLDVVRSRWLTMGAVTQQFEAEFATLTAAKYAFAVSNATVALHLACLAAGLGPGDEAIVPALTFVASANAVLYTGAEVRFADVIGPLELNISPESIEAQITPRTKAIVVVHYGGYPCRMPEILDLARRRNLAVIEDAAHAPASWLDGRHLGAWGDLGCFSFFSNKNLSTGEGGMIVTNRDDLAERVRLLRSHGMTSLTWDRHRGHAYTYDVVELGYNYRIDEIRSALGRVQLAKVAAGNEKRRQISAQYWQAFTSTALELPFCGWPDRPGVEPSCHIFPVLLPEGAQRQPFMEQLKAAGIQTSIHYPPIHTFTYYRQRFGSQNGALPHTEALAAREVTLPLYPTMTAEQVQYVIDTVKEALQVES